MRPKTATFFTNRTIGGFGLQPEVSENADTKIRLHLYKDHTHIGIFRCTYAEGRKDKIDLTPLLLVRVHHRRRTYTLERRGGEEKELDHLGDLFREFWPRGESHLSAYDLFSDLENKLVGLFEDARPIVFEPEDEVSTS